MTAPGQRWLRAPLFERLSQVFMRAILTALGRLLRVHRVSANRLSADEMERQVMLLRERIRYLQVIAMRPGNSPKDLERLRWLEQVARAKVKRRVSEITLVKDRRARASHRQADTRPWRQGSAQSG
jgi:hypothetical protein